MMVSPPQFNLEKGNHVCKHNPAQMCRSETANFVRGKKLSITFFILIIKASLLVITVELEVGYIFSGSFLKLIGK